MLDNNSIFLNNPLAKKFSLNKDDFETLIAFFTPFEDIPLILNTSEGVINDWCRNTYGLDFRQAYLNLLAQARSVGRFMISSLAEKGNNSAINIYSKYFAKFEEEQSNKADTIPIIAVIPLDKPNNKD